jgi:hypothetical protein
MYVWLGRVYGLLLTFPEAPLVHELEGDGTAELHFVNGPVEAFPPEGFEDYFGPGPHYRFIKPAAAEQGGSDILDRIRNFPKGATPEDQMRMLLRGGASAGVLSGSNSDCDSGIDVDSESDTSSIDDFSDQSAQDALDYLYKIMKEDGPFDGIVGYSEGATVAATLLLHEQKRFEDEGIEPMFKCALFFAGWPPLTPELDSIVLADESDLVVTIPTCHISSSAPKLLQFSLIIFTDSLIVGSLDPYLAGSMALYNICEMDNAYLFDHAKGHTLPRDKGTIRELGDTIRHMISNI